MISMTRGRIFVFCFALLSSMTMTYVAPCAYGGIETNKVVFSDLLREIGDKYDCYFTVESVGKEGLQNNKILDAIVQVPTNASQDLNGFIISLTNNLHIEWRLGNKTVLTEFVIDRMEREKPIIRIRDRQLALVTNYSLDRTVSLEYEGAVDGLLDILEKQDSNIRKQRAFLTGAVPMVMDFVTTVRISCKGKTIRDLLTEYIPLPAYNRVIWDSRTNGKQDSPCITIIFHGCRSPNEKRPSQGQPSKQ